MTGKPMTADSVIEVLRDLRGVICLPEDADDSLRQQIAEVIKSQSGAADSRSRTPVPEEKNG